METHLKWAAQNVLVTDIVAMTKHLTKGTYKGNFFFALWLWLTIGGTSHYALKVIVVRTQSNWSDCVCSQEAERGYCCYSAYCLLLWVRGSSTWSNVYQCRVFLPMQLPQSSYLSLVDAQRYIQMLVDWAIPADNQHSSSHWDDRCMVQDWLNSKAKLLLLLSFPLNQFPYIAQDIAFPPPPEIVKSDTNCYSFIF